MTSLPPEGVAVLVTSLTTGYVHISLRCVAALLRQAAKYDDVFSLLEEHESIRIDAVRLGGSGKTALYKLSSCAFVDCRLSHLVDLLSTVQIVKKLIEAGASINRKSKDGATPMEVTAAVCFGSFFSLHVMVL